MKSKNITTKGLGLHIIWKDLSGEWINMKDLKYSYTVPLDNYDVTKELQNDFFRGG